MRSDATHIIFKLTEKELKLVAEKDEFHLKSYSDYHFKRNPDIDPEEMKKSESSAKFVLGGGWRRTLNIHMDLPAYYYLWNKTGINLF